MDKKAIVERLMGNTPLVVMIIGLILFIVGAAGGWSKFQLYVNETSWRVALAAMGAIVSGVGWLLIWRESNKKTTERLKKEYDIKIISPISTIKVDSTIEVSGTYKIKPPDNTIKVFHINPYSYHYYPKTYVRFNDNEKTWHASIYVNVKSGERIIIMVALLGEAGKALCEYFDKVVSRVGHPHGIDTPTPDIVEGECDRITVEHR